MNALFIYAGSVIIVLFGFAHIIPVRSVVDGFGSISDDNRKIFTMEWVAGGVTMIFTGILAALAASFGAGNPLSGMMIQTLILMLIVLSALIFFTGAKTAVVPMKLCPLVTAIVTVLFGYGVISA